MKKLDSNWDRYDLPDMGETDGMIGRTIDDFESSAKTASSFTTNYENSFMPSIAVPLKLELFEGTGSILKKTKQLLFSKI